MRGPDAEHAVLDEEKGPVCLDMEQRCGAFVDQLGGAGVITQSDVNVVTALGIRDRRCRHRAVHDGDLSGDHAEIGETGAL